ncbi:MAG TPA: Stf0 family sulfotransferase [Pirellulales bacterium]|nr:Stf0 family sulfotransferase [Pirellulales bacterium]
MAVSFTTLSLEHDRCKAGEISFCVALMNRGDNFLKMLASWQALEDTNHELIVADFGSTDVDLRDAVASLPQVRIVQLDGPFNRSRGLNAAAASATGEFVFFLDADILLPKDLCSTVRSHVRAGRCYFPICYSLHEGSGPGLAAPGWWRQTGFGLCGFHRDDFTKLRWNESFTSWGGEDNDLRRRVAEHLRIVRERCPGLLHLWHPNGLAFKNLQDVPAEAGRKVVPMPPSSENGQSVAPASLRSVPTSHPTADETAQSADNRMLYSPAKEKPKVGFLLSCLPVGGVGRVIADTAVNVRRIQISGVAARETKPMFAPFAEAFASINCPTYSGAEWQKSAQRVIDESDVLVVWGFGEPAAYSGLNFHGKPAIVQAHNTKENQWTTRVISVAHKANVATHYQACSEAAMESYPVELRPKVRVILNGCEPSRLIPRVSRSEMRKVWRISSDAKIIAYIGRVVPEKRAEHVAFAAEVLGSDFVGLIVGDGVYLAACRNLCKSTRAVFAPVLEHIADGLAAIDVFVNTSKYEGASMTLVEAMLMGVPIVSTVTGSIPEMERAAGRELVHHVSMQPAPDEVAEAVKLALHDHERVRFAKAWAHQHLTARTMAARFEDFVLEIAVSLTRSSVSSTRKLTSVKDYLIAFTQRSGSSWFCSLLRSTMVLGNPYEVFEYTEADNCFVPKLDPNKQGAGQWDNFTWVNHYASHRRCNRTQNGVCGAKVTWQQWGVLIAGLERTPTPDCWVWLRRRDTLRQAISAYRAQMANQWDLFPGVGPSLPPDFNVQRILHHAIVLREQDAAWSHFFDSSRIRPLTLWYEDLCRDPATMVRQVADRLSVETAPAPTSMHIKQADAVSQEWYERLLPTWQALEWR